MVGRWGGRCAEISWRDCDEVLCCTVKTRFQTPDNESIDGSSKIVMCFMLVQVRLMEGQEEELKP